MTSRLSPIQMLFIMHEIAFKNRNVMDRKTEMLIEEAFERLLQKEKEGEQNGHKK